MAEYKELKTSWRQRLGIIIVAVVLLGSTIGIYVGIVLGRDTSSTSGSTADDEALAALQEEYDVLQAQLTELTAPLSDQYFDEFVAYRSRATAYNAAAITELKTNDLKEGTGDTLAEGSTDYLAFYLGWCPDESIFDSSLDSTTDPTTLKSPLPGGNMIEGWNEGIVGMKLGGVRELIIPGDKAYGESKEMCGEMNSPLKFIVMALPSDPEVSALQTQINDVQNQILAIYYGVS